MHSRFTSPAFCRLMAALLLVTTFLAPVKADEITKKDGKVVYGYISRETSRHTFIMRMDGKKERISNSDIESVVLGSDTGDETIDSKIAEGADLGELAKQLKDEKHPGWQVLANICIRDDADNEAARAALGHQKVGDDWFKDPKKAAKAQAKLIAAEMKERGFVKYRNGWASPEDLKLLRKDPDAFTLVDGVWRDTAEVMTEKGFIKMGDKWVKAGTKQDKDDMAQFENLLGEKIWIVTTEHFRLFVQQYQPDQVNRFAERLEEVYAWFIKEVGLKPDTNIFRGNKGHMWVFREKSVCLDWYEQYKNRFNLSENTLKLLSSGSGNLLSSGGLLSTAVLAQGGDDVEHELINHAAHMMLEAFSRSSEKDQRHWLHEAFGVMVEHHFLGNGHIVHSTLAKYGGSGGKADKAFSTADAEERCKGLVRAGDDLPLIELNKIELNSLSGDHISKAYTIVDWLWKEHHKEFVEWLKLMNVNDTISSIPKAFGQDWTHEYIDREWAKRAKKF